MANVEKLSLVALTRSTSNAGSGDVLNVTIDIDGSGVQFTEEQLTAMRGGLTAEEYRWKLIRELLD
jgi:hypothetical protein